MAKKDDEKPEKTEVIEKETTHETVQPTASSIPVATAVSSKDSIENRLESQHKMQIVLAVLLGVLFIWVAFISARMYANRADFNQRNMMNQGQPWGSSNSSGNSMMNGNGSSEFQFR